MSSRFLEAIQKMHAADLVDQLSSKVINNHAQQLFANIKQAGELLTAIAAHADLVKQPASLAEASRLLQSLRYLNHAGLDSLLQDMDRLVHELMAPNSSLSIAKQTRSLRNRPALAVSEQTVSHPLFDPAKTPGVFLRPATVFVSHANGQLEKIEDLKVLICLNQS